MLLCCALPSLVTHWAISLPSLLSPPNSPLIATVFYRSRGLTMQHAIERDEQGCSTYMCVQAHRAVRSLPRPCPLLLGLTLPGQTFPPSPPRVSMKLGPFTRCASMGCQPSPLADINVCVAPTFSSPRAVSPSTMCFHPAIFSLPVPHNQRPFSFFTQLPFPSGL